MATFDSNYAANVKDSSSALVGIAQVRIASQTSMRAAGTGTVVASNTPFTAVGKSTTFLDAADGTTEIVRPSVVYAPNTGTGSPIASGTYTGSVDGCFIVRVLTATTGVMYAPDGTKTALAALAPLAPGAIMGITVIGTITGGAVGDTFVLPVVSGTLQALTQTGIVSPYSMFKGAANSVGGLTDASWDPKLDTIAKMESGFPSQVVDSIVAKTSAGIKFTAQEFTNPIISTLNAMADAAMTGGDIQAIAAEIVFRTRAGNLITYWAPSCTLASVPSISAKNDFSTTVWDLSVNDQTENGSVNTTHAAWLRNSDMYTRLQYKH